MYDNLARVTQTTTTLDNNPYTLNMHYDGNYGRVKALRYPNGLSIAQQYNAQGYLTREINARSGYVYRTISAQDTWGNITQAQINNNQLDEQKLYSPTTGQMLSTRVRHNSSQALRQYLLYTNFDSYGNIKQQQNLANSLNTTENFSYDSLHRLTQSTLSANNLTATIDYGYDSVGNFTKKSDYSANNNQAYQYTSGSNKLGQITLKDGSTHTFTYDNKGNQTHKNNQREMTYNSVNKPTLINRHSAQSQLFYDANWMRYKQIRQKDNTSITTYYLGKHYEVEISTDGSNQALTKTTTYISDIAILSEKTSAGNSAENSEQSSESDIRFTHRDRLGSATSFTDHNGQLTAYRSYDAFGKPKVGDGTLLSSLGLSAKLSNNPLDSDNFSQRGFTDHEHLDDVELIHMNGRVYDYNLGRFLSVDPLIQAPGNSQSINPYSYIMNNPLSGTDPTGYCSGSRIGAKRGSICGGGAGSSYTKNNSIAKLPGVTTTNNGVIAGQGPVIDIFKGVDFKIKTLEEIEEGDSSGTSVGEQTPDGAPTHSRSVGDFGYFDDKGQELFEHWLNGSGESIVADGGEWGDYMKSNPKLRKQIQTELIRDATARGDSGYIFIQFHGEIDNGYKTGYEMLHGTHKALGDAFLVGKALKNDNGSISYDFRASWNDRIDPNPKYKYDKLSSSVLNIFYSPKDYNVHLFWQDSLTVYPRK